MKMKHSNYCNIEKRTFSKVEGLGMVEEDGPRGV